MEFYLGSPTEIGLATGRCDLSADWERTLLLALTGESGFAEASSLLWVRYIHTETLKLSECFSCQMDEVDNTTTSDMKLEIVIYYYYKIFVQYIYFLWKTKFHQ